jgi:hypothetical protein
VVVPVDAEIHEAEDVGQEDRDDSTERFEIRSGALSSRTEIVITMAITASVNAEPPRGHGSR